MIIIWSTLYQEILSSRCNSRYSEVIIYYWSMITLKSYGNSPLTIIKLPLLWTAALLWYEKIYGMDCITISYWLMVMLWKECLMEIIIFVMVYHGCWRFLVDDELHCSWWCVMLRLCFLGMVPFTHPHFIKISQLIFLRLCIPQRLTLACIDT